MLKIKPAHWVKIDNIDITDPKSIIKSIFNHPDDNILYYFLKSSILHNCFDTVLFLVVAHFFKRKPNSENFIKIRDSFLHSGAELNPNIGTNEYKSVAFEYAMLNGRDRSTFSPTATPNILNKSISQSPHSTNILTNFIAALDPIITEATALFTRDNKNILPLMLDEFTYEDDGEYFAIGDTNMCHRITSNEIYSSFENDITKQLQSFMLPDPSKNNSGISLSSALTKYANKKPNP